MMHLNSFKISQTNSALRYEINVMYRSLNICILASKHALNFTFIDSISTAVCVIDIFNGSAFPY